MKRYLSRFLVLILILCMGCQETPKKVFTKDDLYKEIKYEDSYFTLKNIEFFYDYYNYAYIPYIRIWFDMSNMNERDLRWILDEQGSIYTRGSFMGQDWSISKNLSGTLYCNFTVFNFIKPQFDEETKELFLFAYGEGVKELEDLSKNIYRLTVKVEGKEWPYWFGANSYDGEHIPCEFKSIDNYPDLQKAFRKINAKEY